VTLMQKYQTNVPNCFFVAIAGGLSGVINLESQVILSQEMSTAQRLFHS